MDFQASPVGQAYYAKSNPATPVVCEPNTSTELIFLKHPNKIVCANTSGGWPSTDMWDHHSEHEAAQPPERAHSIIALINTTPQENPQPMCERNGLLPPQQQQQREREEDSGTRERTNVCVKTLNPEFANIVISTIKNEMVSVQK